MTVRDEYSNLVRRIMRSAARSGQPARGSFELTSRCNLSCRMCYIGRPPGHQAAHSGELSPQVWISIAKQAFDRGMLFSLLTGGEPFLRPDFFEIYDPLRAMGLSITLFTNGTLITPESARRLAEQPPNRLEITLYGATQDTYEAVTGVPGSFRQCLSGIDNLLCAGIKPRLKSTLSMINAHELDAMHEMARSRGLEFGFGGLLSFRRDGDRTAIQQLRLSAEQFVALETKIPQAVEGWTRIAGRKRVRPEKKAFYCNAGRNSFAIGPSGDMNVCIDLPLPKARPIESGFAEAWKQVREFVRSVSLPRDCESCDLKPYCGLCPGWSFSEAGNLTSVVPYHCEIARERRRRYAAGIPRCT